MGCSLPGSRPGRGSRSGASSPSWAVEHLRYRLLGTTDERTAEVLRAARELISGVAEKKIDRMGPEVMAAILPRVYPQMLDEVHAHQDAGRATFIVSAAGNGVVASLAQVLGMEGGIGTRYEVDGEGNFTGRFDGPFVYGHGKVEAMQAFAAEHEIDLASPTPTRTRCLTCRCCARSATRWPSTPIPPLAEIARQEGWQTMRFERLGRRLLAVASPCWRRSPASAARASPRAASAAPPLRGAALRVAPA